MASNRVNRAIEDYQNIGDKIEYMQRRVEEVQEEMKAERQAQIDRIVIKFNLNNLLLVINCSLAEYYPQATTNS